MRAYYAGRGGAVPQDLGAAMGLDLLAGLPAEPRADDLVFLESAAEIPAMAGWAGGHAFAACRALKRIEGLRVFFVLDEDDPYTEEIARFCLADGCVLRGPDGWRDLETLARRLEPRPPSATEGLLFELEQELSSDEGRAASVIQQMLGRDRQQWVLEILTDKETGLFDGPFASFKLDEEFKRASRFHTPLALLLLDIGDGAVVLPAEENQRRLCLAEVAAVFLSGCRDIDTLARFTETTFLFLLPGTGLDGAKVLGHRLLRELAGREFQAKAGLSPCAGLATAPAAGISKREQLLARAEACLKLARRGEGEGGLCAGSE